MDAAHRIINKDDPKAHYELCDLPDCVYLSEKGVCERLRVKQCVGVGCAFKQNRGSFEADSKNWQARLSCLSDEQQTQIAQKYYGGRTPWKTGDMEEKE